MIYNEVVHQVVVLASNFHSFLYYINVVILWLVACCLRLEACRLPLGILRLGACSSLPLIVIRGPYLAQALLMILSSAAMVCSCGPDAFLTSIVNCFMFLFYLLIVFVSGRLELVA